MKCIISGTTLFGVFLAAGAGACAQTSALPFHDGRYLSDTSMCAMTVSQMVERIGDEIHYVLIDIEAPYFNGVESICEVRRVERSGDDVTIEAECALEGTVQSSTFTVAYVSDEAFAAGGRLFERCG